MSDNRGQMTGPANETIRQIRATGRRWKIILSIGYGAFLLVVGVVPGYAYWALPPEIVRTQVFTDPRRIGTVLGWSIVVWLVLLGVIHLYVLYSVWRAKAVVHDPPAATDPADERRNFVCVMERDEQAVLVTPRRAEFWIPVVGAVLTGFACWGFSSKPLPGPGYYIVAFLVIWLVAALCAYRYRELPKTMRNAEIWIGGDFIGVFMPERRGSFFSKFRSIKSILLNISEERMKAVMILAKEGVLKVTLSKDLTTLLRTLLERTGPEVKWRRRFHPFSRFSREEVKTLIEATGGGLDINTLLPPGSAYMSLDELMPPNAGPGQIQSQSIVFLSTTLLSPAHRYASFMLMKMFLGKEWTRTLRRCEELRPLSNEKETVEPPPLADIVNRLKTMCGRKIRTHKEPIDASFDITMNRVPCKITCHFDDSSDACCTIHLETVETRKDG